MMELNYGMVIGKFVVLSDSGEGVESSGVVVLDVCCGKMKLIIVSMIL